MGFSVITESGGLLSSRNARASIVVGSLVAEDRP